MNGEERRQDYQNFAVFIQKFSDFMDNTYPYRKRQDDKFDLIFNKLAEVKTTLDKLPCDTHVAVASQVHMSFEKVNKDQWGHIRALWIVIGSACLAIFGAWLNIKK